MFKKRKKKNLSIIENIHIVIGDIFVGVIKIIIFLNVRRDARRVTPFVYDLTLPFTIKNFHVKQYRSRTKRRNVLECLVQTDSLMMTIFNLRIFHRVEVYVGDAICV